MPLSNQGIISFWQIMGSNPLKTDIQTTKDTVSEDEYWPIGPVWSKWVLFIQVFSSVKALPSSYPPEMF